MSSEAPRPKSPTRQSRYGDGAGRGFFTKQERNPTKHAAYVGRAEKHALPPRPEGRGFRAKSGEVPDGHGAVMSNLLECGRLGRPLTDYDVIDAHAHLGRWDYAISDFSAESVIATMDRLGVRQMVCSSLECAGSHVEAGNDEVLAAMRAFPGRVLGYLVLWPESPEAVRAETERRLAEGFTGVKLHNSNGFDYTIPAYAPAFEIADERRLPVLLHTYGEQPGLEQVPELAERYPEATFLLAHAGVGTIEEYIRLAREYENVHLDLCTSMCPVGVVERLVSDAPIEKILWGSDVQFLNLPHQLGKLLGADIPEEAKKQLLSTNAKRVLSRIRT